MKIAIVHTDFRIYWPARLKALSSFLQKQGIELEVVEIAGAGSPYAFAGKEKQEGMVWHILFPSSKMEELRNCEIKKRLFELLNRIRPDIVIAGAIAFPSGAISVAWAKKYKKKVICFDDAKIEAVKRNGIVNFIKRNIYNGVYAMLYPSSDWEATGNFWGFGKEQMFYGIDVVDNEFWQDCGDCEQCSKRYFLAVGRQIPKKNFYHIVRSYKSYLDRYKKDAFHLYLVGDGPEHESIQQYVKSNYLSEYVTLLPFKSQKELKQIYHNAEILILSSNSDETWGLVINEAMACGVPVIASNQCGATHTLIHNGINGYSFPLEERDALVNRMCMYHELPTRKKEKMRIAALCTISEWGLGRFCQCCFDAINYVAKMPQKKFSLINSFIIDMWKGRYRPI